MRISSMRGDLRGGVAKFALTARVMQRVEMKRDLRRSKASLLKYRSVERQWRLRLGATSTGRSRPSSSLKQVSSITTVLFATLAWTGRSRAQAEEKLPEGVEDLDLVKLLNVEVSTATKTAENIDEAPAVITVVTRADIERWGYQTVAEVLQHTLAYLTDDHILPNVGVRGMTGGLGAESGMIKVMIDGRSVAYRTTSGNWLGVELVPLESVAQIENHPRPGIGPLRGRRVPRRGEHHHGEARRHGRVSR